MKCFLFKFIYLSTIVFVFCCSFTLSCLAGEKDSSTLSRLQHISLGKVSLNNLSMGEIFEYIRKSSLQNDPMHKGINFVFIPPEDKNIISYFAEDISCYDALKQICDGSNMKFRIDSNAVVIAPIESNLQTKLIEEFPVNNIMPFTFANNADSAKKYLRNGGVVFSKGANAEYIPSSDTLKVVANYKNLAKIKNLLSEAIPPLCLVEVKYIEISQTKLDELKEKYLIKHKKNILWKQNKWNLIGSLSKTISTASIIAHSGYKGSSFLEIDDKIRISLNVTPTVNRDFYTINLHLHSTLKYKNGDGALNPLIKMCDTGNRNIVLYDGETIPLEKHIIERINKKTGKKETIHLIALLKARMATSAGEPLRRVPITTTYNQIIYSNTKSMEWEIVEENNDTSTVASMKRIIFKSISFKNTPVSEALKNITQKAKKIDTFAEGINILFANQFPLKEQEPKITLELRNISLGDTIKYICILADMCYDIKDKVVVFCQGTNPRAEFPIKEKLLEVKTKLPLEISISGYIIEFPDTSFQKLFDKPKEINILHELLPKTQYMVEQIIHSPKAKLIAQCDALTVSGKKIDLNFSKQSSFRNSKTSLTPGLTISATPILTADTEKVMLQIELQDQVDKRSCTGFKTTTTLSDGYYIFIGKTSFPDKQANHLYFFIRARVMRPNGTFLRKREIKIIKPRPMGFSH